jgi:hypothetical protein
VAESAYNDASPDATAKAICYHIQIARNEIARQLWSHHVFVGISVIDELLFDATKRGEANPVYSVLEQLGDGRCGLQTLIVFPLQDFGIIAGGLLRPFRQMHPVITDELRRVSITTQTNNLLDTVEYINLVGPLLVVSKKVEYDLIEHWYRSRSARWLKRNPPLVAGVNAISGHYYENEFLILGRIRSLTTAIALIASMQPSAAADSSMCATLPLAPGGLCVKPSLDGCPAVSNVTTDSVAFRALTAVPPPYRVSTGTPSISDKSAIVISRSSSLIISFLPVVAER